MNKVIITGATGLIGLALIKQCIQNRCKVFAVVRPNSKRLSVLPKSDLIHIVECDLANLNDLKVLIQDTCDVFYHLGWGHTGTAKEDDVKFQTENIDFTIDAVRIAKEIGCKLFVGAGSQAEYGPLDLEKISVDSPVDPKIPYGVCKLAAGKLAATEAAKLGLVCVWVRIFSVYGFNDKKDMLLGSIMAKMKNNECIEMTKGIQQWDYLFCNDAGRAFYLIGKKCKTSAIYCLGSGKKRPLKEYIAIVANVLGYDVNKINYGAIPYTEASVMNLCADISELTKDTGFVPEVSFEEGIQLYVEDYFRELEYAK